MNNIINVFLNNGLSMLDLSNLTGVRSLRFLRQVKENKELIPYSLNFLLIIELKFQETKETVEVDKEKARELGLSYLSLTKFSNWEHPTPLEIKSVCNSIGGGSSSIGALVGVTGSNVRKFIGGHKKIPYSVWALMCYEANIGAIWR